MATTTYELIETTTLTSSASSVSFTSITQDYRDLVLVIDATGTSAGPSFSLLRFNGDTGFNYPAVRMQGDGSSTSSGSGTGDYLQLSNSSLTSGSPLTQIVQIMDYSATDKHKTAIGRDSNASVAAQAGAGRWANTSAITTILCAALGNTYASGSTFSLYGIAS